MTLKPVNVVVKRFTFSKDQGVSCTKTLVPLKRTSSVASGLSTALDREIEMDPESKGISKKVRAPHSFLGFPYEWVWKNTISCGKFQANRSTSSQQIHILQDFNLMKEGKYHFFIILKSIIPKFLSIIKSQIISDSLTNEVKEKLARSNILHPTWLSIFATFNTKISLHI
jgi:hypothetical protein